MVASDALARVATHWWRTTTEYLKVQLYREAGPTNQADFLHTTHGTPRPARPLGTLDYFLLLAAHARIQLAMGKLHSDVLSYRDLIG